LSTRLQEKPTGEWIQLLKGKGMPFAPINNIQGTFEHEQAKFREVVREVEHPRAGKIKVLAPAVTYSGKKMEVKLSSVYLKIKANKDFLRSRGHLLSWVNTRLKY
jgi:succinate---hydroxymethylglutarate CoA-transferase